MQNRLFPLISPPHLLHFLASSLAPHREQTVEPIGLSSLQFEHIIGLTFLYKDLALEGTSVFLAVPLFH